MGGNKLRDLLVGSGLTPVQTHGHFSGAGHMEGDGTCAVRCVKAAVRWRACTPHWAESITPHALAPVPMLPGFFSSGPHCCTPARFSSQTTIYIHKPTAAVGDVDRSIAGLHSGVTAGVTGDRPAAAAAPRAPFAGRDAWPVMRGPRMGRPQEVAHHFGCQTSRLGVQTGLRRGAVHESSSFRLEPPPFRS